MTRLVVLFLLSFPCIADPIIGDPILGMDDPILGSKHDFANLNERAGVNAMQGVAFSDYGYSCVYCHLPVEESGSNVEGSVPEWNRFSSNQKNIKMYSSVTTDSKASRINPISMLCLSCHDGTQAIDMVVFRPPTYSPEEDKSMHMAMGIEDDIEHCGKCHNGIIAHNIDAKVIGTDMRNDHPVSMRYAGLDWEDPDFRSPDNEEGDGFKNGVKLYDGNVECMTCHDVHDPSNEMLLRQNAEVLCMTCHIK